MRQFDEGRLRFGFHGADVGKYDEWRFYQNRFKGSCNGNKAVDFVYVEADRTWLIKVKDYRRHRRTKPGDLADEVAIKVRDTLAGLAAAKSNANDKMERRLARCAFSDGKNIPPTKAPALDDRTPVWEALHHMIRRLNEDNEVAGELLARMPEKGEPLRQLAYHLYTLCERKKWAEDARAYNELIQSWHAIVAASHEVGHKGEQQGLDI